MTLNEAVKYWQDSSKKDSYVAQDLFQNSHYNWCLFLWQLTIEKLLKAKIASKGMDIPYTHDLSKLAQAGGLTLSHDSVEKLNEITSFSLEARYDDFKQSFYHKANREYAEKWQAICQELYLWIEKQIS